jgi:hypothetical protein
VRGGCIPALITAIKACIQIGAHDLFHSNTSSTTSTAAETIAIAIGLLGNITTDPASEPTHLSAILQLRKVEIIVSALKVVDKSLSIKAFGVTSSPAASQVEPDMRLIIASKCLKTVVRLCVRSDFDEGMFGSIGGCDAVVAVIRALKTEVKIAESGSAALGNLSHAAANRSRIGAAKGCSLLLELLELHNKNETVVQYTCIAVFNLCSLYQNRVDFISINAEGRIESVLRGFSSDSKVSTVSLSLSLSLSF